MGLSAIIDSIRSASVPQGADVFELYRRDVFVPSGGSESDIRLSVLDVYPRNPKQTLLLLHGYAANSAWWRPQLPALAQDHRVIVIDARGNGLSQHTELGNTVQQQVEDALAVLDRLNISEPVVVAGHSAGGFVATDLALRYPERVSKLILIATPFAFREGSTVRTANFFMSFPDFIFRLGQPLYELDPRGQASLLGLRRLFKDSLLGWNGRNKFPHITQPTLVIEGHRDALFASDSYSQVVAAIPNANPVQIRVSKHQVTLERPKAVLRAMLRFIEPEAVTYRPPWRSENDNIASVAMLAKRPWIARYEGEMSPELVIPDVPLPRLLAYAARQFGHTVAVQYGYGRPHHRLTYKELFAEANRFSRVLRDKGIQVGDRVMVWLPNTSQSVIALFGITQLGAIAVFSDPEVGASEFHAQMTLASPDLLVTSETLAASIGMDMNDCPMLTISETDYEPALMRERAKTRAEGKLLSPDQTEGIEWKWFHLREMAADEQVHAAVTAADTAVILFTSGSERKPVQLTHANLVAGAVQSGSWMSFMPFAQGSILSAVSFSSAYGLVLGVVTAVYKAVTINIPTDLGTDSILNQIKRTQPQLCLAFPDQYLTWTLMGNIRQFMPKSLPLFISSGAPLPVELEEAFQRVTHADLLELYGMTETGYATHISPRQRDRTGSVGLPLPNTDIQIVDLQSGELLPFGYVGELWVRGPQVMRGYWQDETATRQVIDEEGWLHTGDLAEMDDDGFFRILGRHDNIQLKDGTLIFPRDVEETLYELPGVRETAVLVQNKQLVAYICCMPGENLSSEVILAFCQKRLPATHQPDQVLFLDALPRSHSGKLLVNQLPQNGTL